MARSVMLCCMLVSCSSGGDSPSPFDDLAQETLRSGVVTFRVWIADTPATRQRGLMDATEADLATRSDGAIRGMLFVFPTSQRVSFFMRDTEVPLDLAYLDETGRIVETHALIPLDETPVPSSVPVRYALEVRAGRLPIGVGDVIELP
ncbi:MAG: DUF192 domain-containing protein [Planctomycetota bacterium]